MNESPTPVRHDSASSVLKIIDVPELEKHTLVARQDGLCQVYDLGSGMCSMQLTGPDCDPVYDCCTVSGVVYAASRDAVIRSYAMNSLR